MSRIEPSLTLLSTVARPCHTPKMPWHAVAQPRHDRATALQPVENIDNKNVMTFLSLRANFFSQYQPLRAIRRQLRGVWRKTRSDAPSKGPTLARVPGQRPGNPGTAGGRRGLLPAALTLAILPVLASADGFQKTAWSSSGEFTLAGALTTRTVWSQPSSEWSAFDRFERSAPARGPAPVAGVAIGSGSVHDRLLDVIASAEAGPKGYDAIHYSATRLPAKPPSQLTVGEIFAWIRATPGQHHAIGRYQFIPSTLAYLVQAEGIGTDAVFGPALQKRLALRLMIDAGYNDFLQGAMSRSRFQDRLARIWAGLPLSNGRSAYHGTAGNRATISRASFDSAMVSIFGR